MLSEEQAHDPRVEVRLGNVTKSLPYADGEVKVILDKGTMDALEGDDDKMAMLQECSRVLDKNHGALLSISFGSVLRLQFLDKVCSSQGLFGGSNRRTYLIGDKDPRKGHDVRFLTVYGHGLEAVPYIPSSLTKEVLKRIQITGSMYVSLEDHYEDLSMEDMQQAADAEFQAAIS